MALATFVSSNDWYIVVIKLQDTNHLLLGTPYLDYSFDYSNKQHVRE